jgi:hypothetical protein
LSIQTLGRVLVALAIGMVVPYACDELWRWVASRGVLSDGWAQASSWAFVCVAAAWLVSPFASRAVLSFVAYGLPFDENAARLLALHFGVLGLAWPALIVLLARRRARG